MLTKIKNRILAEPLLYFGQHGPTLEEPIGVDLTYPIQWHESRVDLSELAKLRKAGWTTEQLVKRFKRKISTIRGYYQDIQRLEWQY